MSTYKPTLSKELWGSNVNLLNKEELTKLENFNDLPYGEIKKVLKVLDPDFGAEDEGVRFLIRASEERTITESRVVTFTVRAESKEDAKRIANRLLYTDQKDLEELDDFDEESDWDEDDVEYGSVSIIEVEPKDTNKF